MKTSLRRENRMFCMRESHWNGHFCLSPESDDGVRLKVLREHVYQFKLRSMIITLWRTQCQVPECVKAVIISKKRTMWESVSLPLCFRTELSQCAWVKVCASFFEPSQKKKQVKRCSHVWLLCPSAAHLFGFIFTLTFTSVSVAFHFLQIPTKAVEPEDVADVCFKNKTLQSWSSLKTFTEKTAQ